MRTLRWALVAAVLLGGCAASRNDREVALLLDARQCEEESDDQLRAVEHKDSTVRMLFFQSCMALRGWQGR